MINLAGALAVGLDAKLGELAQALAQVACSFWDGEPDLLRIDGGIFAHFPPRLMCSISARTIL